MNGPECRTNIIVEVRVFWYKKLSVDLGVLLGILIEVSYFLAVTQSIIGPE